MINVLYWIYKNRAIVGYMLLAIALLIGVYFMWAHFHPPNPIVFESQQQASTPAGVEQAANVAEIPISPVEASAIVNAIKEDADKPLAAVVQTTGVKLENTIKTELQKSGGQFAIVTDTKNLDSVPTVDKTVAVPASGQVKTETVQPKTPVTLNQYNIRLDKPYGIGVYAGTHSVGAIMQYNNVFVFGGPQYQGGYEIGAGFLMRF